MTKVEETNLGLPFSPSKEFVGELFNWGKEFGPLLEKRAKLGKKQRRIVLDYLSCAKEDVKASRLLRQKGMISLSIYHLQQAVEKATKAYALDSGVVTPQELRKKIGHTSPLGFLEMMKDRWVVGFGGILKSVYPDYQPDVSRAELVIKTQQKDIAKWDKEAILKLLDLDKRVEAALKSSSTKSQMSLSLDMIPTIFAGKFPQKQLVGRLKMAKRNLYAVMDIAISFNSLYLLSVITYPHFSFTRYADGEIKPTDYVKGLGIVDCQAKLLTRVSHAISTLEKNLTKGKKSRQP